jgi:RNA polymerase sigma factor (sigma-70 family)
MTMSQRDPRDPGEPAGAAEGDFADPLAAGGANDELTAAQCLLVGDRALLDRFRQGEPTALDQVYRHFVKDVTRYLRSGFMYSTGGQSARHPGIGSAFELESAVQETFARAFEPRARVAYDGLRPYGGFLVGVARHVALDALRRSARRKEQIEAPDTLERHAEVAATPDVAASVDQRRAEELVRRFLADECDEKDRALYRLRYDEDQSQEAAAEALGLTRIQVRRRETKFRERLLRYLKRADYVRQA